MSKLIQYSEQKAVMVGNSRNVQMNVKVTNVVRRSAIGFSGTALILAMTGCGWSGINEHSTQSTTVPTTPPITVSQQRAPAENNEEVIKAEKSFFYRGHPINPHIVALFTSWLSDQGGPAVLAVSLRNASLDTNQFDDADVYHHGRLVGYAHGSSYFEYRFCGALADGTVVLQTYKCTGGSGVYEALLFFRFAKTGRRGLAMRLCQFVDLKDRYGGRVEVHSHEVIIEAFRSPPLPIQHRMIIHWPAKTGGGWLGWRLGDPPEYRGVYHAASPHGHGNPTSARWAWPWHDPMPVALAAAGGWGEGFATPQRGVTKSRALMP